MAHGTSKPPYPGQILAPTAAASCGGYDERRGELRGESSSSRTGDPLCASAACGARPRAFAARRLGEGGTTPGNRRPIRLRADSGFSLNATAPGAYIPATRAAADPARRARRPYRARGNLPRGRHHAATRPRVPRNEPEASPRLAARAARPPDRRGTRGAFARAKMPGAPWAMGTARDGADVRVLETTRELRDRPRRERRPGIKRDDDQGRSPSGNPGSALGSCRHGWQP